MDDLDVNKVFYVVQVVCSNCGEINEKEIVIMSDGDINIDDAQNLENLENLEENNL